MRPRPTLSACLAGFAVSAAMASHADAESRPPAPAGEVAPKAVSEVVVTASRLDLLGRATTASQGVVTRKEIELRPIFRVGQLFESIPGLVVTIHSGEGKANQYLIRGYNLDHGSDFASFVDGMPVNRPTNTHGQGYSDLNFLIPQVVSRIDYTKGPYFAAVGDFGAVASAKVLIVDEIRDQIGVTLGTGGYRDVFAGGSYSQGPARRLMAAIDLGHYDGPWRPPQNFRKINAILRYSEGSAADGASLTAMYYRSSGGLITDQPQRAVEAGLIDRFGTLDPSDHSQSLRYSLSGRITKPLGRGQVAAALYGVRSTMTLWNNFTHFLDDPAHGDQESQGERRTTLGGAAEYSQNDLLGPVAIDTTIGLQARYDDVFVNRRHTLHRTTVLDYCEAEQDDGSTIAYPAVQSYCNADRARLLDLAPYIQATVRWTPWLRTAAGFREEYYHARDVSRVAPLAGRGHQWLAQPKASVILGPWWKTELYVSAGRGFHSDDVRGVFGAVPQEGVPLAGGKTPLLARTSGIEAGLRTDVIPKTMLQVTAFQQDFRSELTYNADTGQDEAGAPSRRKGIEVSGQYRPRPWLELNADLAFARARYRARNLAAYGLDQSYIADAPNLTSSFGILVDNLGAWSGGLQYRRLGSQSLADGQKYPLSPGYSEWNLQFGYRLPSDIEVQLSIFNIFDSHDAAAEYYYLSRLNGEPAGGVRGLQAHPLEPRSARISLTKLF